MQAIDEVNFLIFFWQWKWMPFCLLRERLDFRIDGQETVCDIRLCLNRNVALCDTLVYSCRKFDSNTYYEQLRVGIGTYKY